MLQFGGPKRPILKFFEHCSKRCGGVNLMLKKAAESKAQRFLNSVKTTAELVNWSIPYYSGKLLLLSTTSLTIHHPNYHHNYGHLYHFWQPQPLTNESVPLCVTKGKLFFEVLYLLYAVYSAGLPHFVREMKMISSQSKGFLGGKYQVSAALVGFKSYSYIWY